MFIDTHAHLYADVFDEDRIQMVNRAIENGVEVCLLPNIDSSSVEGMLDLCGKFPKNCFPMIGLHPGSVGENWQLELAQLKQQLFSGDFIAVGEIGMDLYWDKTFIEEQRFAFIEQIGWAKELNLPIAIHARDAFDEIFSVLDELNDGKLTGVFHCFTGNVEQANKIIDYGGFKLGIGGVLTYKNSDLPEVLKSVSLEHIILETDAPYLPPVPFRGKRNESSYIMHIAEKLADVYTVSLKTIEEQTTKNALELFKKCHFNQ